VDRQPPQERGWEVDTPPEVLPLKPNAYSLSAVTPSASSGPRAGPLRPN
jgi:hypothetical protein